MKRRYLASELLESERDNDSDTPAATGKTVGISEGICRVEEDIARSFTLGIKTTCDLFSRLFEPLPHSSISDITGARTSDRSEVKERGVRQSRGGGIPA